MKRIKLFLCVALFGAMSYGAFTAYDYYTMSEEERFLLENIEALTERETGNGTDFTCRCGLFWGDGCRTDNWGSNCAIPGVIDCSKYDFNCK